MSSSSASKVPPYTLYLYSPHPQSHQQLPVLDPAGLYIASLLRTLSGPPTATSSSSPSSSSSSSAAPLPTSLPFDIKAPSVYWHSTLPRLERNQPAGGVCVAEGVRDIEAFASARLAASAVRQAQEDEEDSQSWELKPLEAHLASLVEPLVYSVFFPPPARGVGGSMGRSSPDGPASAAQDVFDQITFPVYAQGLPFPLSRAIPHRLRERISAEVAAGSKLFRQLGSGSQQQQQKKKREVASDPEMERRRKEMAPLAFGSGRKGILGFGAGEKEEWKEEFWKQKMTSLGKQIFSPLLAFVPSSDSPSTTTKQQPLPRPLIHLYALLAPLLLSSPTLKNGKGSAPKSNPLSAHPLVHLLTTADEYEPLRRFVHRMHGEIWGVDETQTEVAAQAETEEEREVDRVYGDLTGWKTLYSPSSTSAGTVGEDVPTGARSSSSSNSWRSYLPSFLRPSSASTSTSKKTPTPTSPTEPLSPLQQAALRRLRIGRAVWITSALLGTVGWLLVSGIVQVSFSEEEDEEDEEEEEVEEVIIEDTIGDGEGVQEGMDVVVLDGEDDEDEDDDDEEEEDEEEDEGVEWTFVRGSEQVDLDQPVEIVLGDDDDDEDEL